MKILSVCAEFSPWCKTGGLGDVTGALPEALNSVDDSVSYTTAVPLYQTARKNLTAQGAQLEKTELRFEMTLGGHHWTGHWLRLVTGARHAVFFLDCPELFDTEGLYDSPVIEKDGQSFHLSLAVKFGFFGEACLQSMDQLVGGVCDVLHCHDWHAGHVVRRVRESLGSNPPKTILTIHNLAYQGWFERSDCPEIAHPKAPALHFLAEGIRNADLVTTVSPRYSVEIQTPEFGCGLDSDLRSAGVSGVLNGIGDDWSPTSDPHIQTTFTSPLESGRDRCRQALIHETGWASQPNRFTLGIVSRLDHQKGLDWVAETIPQLEALNARLVLLGTGDPHLENTFRNLADAHSSTFCAWLNFDVPQSHRIIAGVDALLVPSRFEPCGLTQLYAMAYGTVPIVNPVGGLFDTVSDPGDEALGQGEGTGFRMASPSAQGLHDAIERAATLWASQPKTWQALMMRGHQVDSSWTRSAEHYIRLMRGLVTSVGPP